MGQPDTAASIQACALRLARLAADGSTPAGATNGYVTKNFITLTMSPEINEGQDFSEQNACGDEVISARDRPIYRRWNVDLELMVPDPEVGELLCAAPLILSTPASARVLAANGTTTNASPIVSSPTAAFTTLDLGATLTGTGVGVGAVIISIDSPTQATLSVASTATANNIAFTITPIAQSIGLTAPELGTQASDNGVSVELWTKAYIGAGPAPVLPYFRWALTRSYWRFNDREFANARMANKFTGYAIENSNWGNGPWNDWVEASPSTRSLSRAWGYHRTSSLPTPSVGYVAVPTQV